MECGANPMHNDVWEEIGERIEWACHASGKMMAVIANEAGVSEEALRMWRRGQAFPSKANWEALAKAVGMSVRDLLMTEPQRRRLRA